MKSNDIVNGGSSSHSLIDLLPRTSQLVAQSPATGGGSGSKLSKLKSVSLLSQKGNSSKNLSSSRSSIRMRRAQSLTPGEISRVRSEIINRDSMHMLHGSERPCFCDPQTTSEAMARLFNRWDNLLLLLVCAMVILLVLTSPVSIFFGGRR